MAAGDEPSLGELSRNIQALTRSVEMLSGRVVTTEVWSTERQMIDLEQIEKAKQEAAAEREKDRSEAKADRDKVQSFRRSIIFAISTALFAPILTGIVLIVVQRAGGGG